MKTPTDLFVNKLEKAKIFSHLFPRQVRRRVTVQAELDKKRVPAHTANLQNLHDKGLVPKRRNKFSELAVCAGTLLFCE